MKARWMIGLGAVVVSVGLAVGVSTAAMLTFEVRLGAGETGQVTLADPTVNVELWAVLQNTDGNPNNDGFATGQGNIISGSTLLGDFTSWSVGSSFQVTPWQNGNRVDLDADGDLDVGSTVASADSNWIFPNSGSTYITGTEVLLGSGVWTLTDLSPVVGEQTSLQFTKRDRPGSLSASRIFYFKVDGNNFALFGRDATIASGSPALITFVPEPVTMLLLVGGGGVLVAMRRRRKSA
jgi:hypothetical protein